MHHFSLIIMIKLLIELINQGLINESKEHYLTSFLYY